MNPEVGTKSDDQAAELGGNDEKNNVLEAIVWALFSIVGIMPYFVTVGYWTIVYKPELVKYSPVNGIYMHGINAVMSLLDTFIIAIPVRLAHLVYLLTFASAYVLFRFVSAGLR